MQLTSFVGLCFVIPPRCNKAALQIESDYRKELFANLSEKHWIRAFKIIVFFTQLKSIYYHMTRFPYSLKTF